MVAMLTVLACGSGGEGEACASCDLQIAGPNAAPLPADFPAFYERFHADSAYQMAHVTWPLDGNIVTTAVGERRDERWTADAWLLHRPLDLGETYVRELDASSGDAVIERIKTTEGKYLLERRFAKLGTEWYLIWYRVAELT